MSIDTSHISCYRRLATLHIHLRSAHSQLSDREARLPPSGRSCHLTSTPELLETTPWIAGASVHVLQLRSLGLAVPLNRGEESSRCSRSTSPPLLSQRKTRKTRKTRRLRLVGIAMPRDLQQEACKENQNSIRTGWLGRSGMLLRRQTA